MVYSRKKIIYSRKSINKRLVKLGWNTANFFIFGSNFKRDSINRGNTSNSVKLQMHISFEHGCYLESLRTSPMCLSGGDG